MAEYQTPGVYIEESSLPHSIEAASTSTAAFVGEAERGPTRPTLVTSWAEYQKSFGGFVDRAPFDSTNIYLPYAVRGFFDNGGGRLFVARVIGAESATAALELIGQPGSTVLEAIGPGVWGNNVVVSVRPATAGMMDPEDLGGQTWFRLQLMYFADGVPTPFVDPTDPAEDANPARREPDVLEDFDNLSSDSTQPNFALTAVNGVSQLVVVKACDGRPIDSAPGVFQLAGGITVDASELDYLGSADSGLGALSTIDEISIVAIPDAFLPAHKTLASNFQNVCDSLRDRFAIHAHSPDTGQVKDVHPLQDSSYGAIYYPLVLVDAPHTASGSLYVPAVGHIAGIYARTDTERGVHKAPANEVVRGIIEQDLKSGTKPLSHLLTQKDQDLLNPRGVNVIRDFRDAGRGIRVWGARTMSSDSEFRYVNVRRLLVMIEESIAHGTHWVTFEPNAPPTWVGVRTSIENFLMTLWRAGALMGSKADEAFFVRCDRTTMTQDDIDNGRLVGLVGVAPVKPAEFVLLRFSHNTIESKDP